MSNIINERKYYKRIKQLNIAHYSGEISYYSVAPLRKVEKVILNKLNKNANILDLGCGSGRFSINAAKRGFNVTGVDITTAAITAAQRRSDQENLTNANFLVGDMTELPFSNNAFDYVICPRFSINAVATFDMRVRAVREMLRVVKPDGIIYIESFNRWYLGRGLWLPLKNYIFDLFRYAEITINKLSRKEYKGLLPGDITYKSNKVVSALSGYAHLPTPFELIRLAPTKRRSTYDIVSIPELTRPKKRDLLKLFRYSIWLIINKKHS